MSIERKAAAGLRSTATAKIAVQAISWLVTLVVLRLLSPADYGLMAMVTVAISMASSIGDMGLAPSMVQARTLSGREQAEVTGMIMMLNLAIAAGLLLGAPLIAAAFAEPSLTPLIRTMAITFVFGALHSVPMAMLERDLNFPLIARIDLASGVIASMATLALAASGFGVWALVLGFVASSFSKTALVVWFGRNVFPRLPRGDARKHLRYGGMLTLVRLSWSFIQQSDVMIASRFLSHAALGAYSVGLHLATMPMQKIMSIVNAVAFSTVARLQDQPERLRQGLLRAFRLASLASVPLLWGLASCAPEFVRLVLGDGWSQAIFPLQVMSLVIPFRMVSGLMSTAISAIGRVDIYVRIIVAAAIVMPACFLAGAQWGLEGMAACWPLAWLINFVIWTRHLAKPLSLSVRDLYLAMRGPITAGLAMVAAIHALRALLGDLGDLPRLLLMIAAGAGSYLAVIRSAEPEAWSEVKRLARASRGAGAPEA